MADLNHLLNERKQWLEKLLKRIEKDLAKKLAQKAYLLQLKDQLRTQLVFLKAGIPDLSDQPFLKVFEGLTVDRKKLTIPLFEDDDTFVNHWLSAEYERLPFDLGTPVHITDRGERVRSKSEKILADRFYALGIPYLYEKPIRITRNKKRVPDFTMLNIRRLETFYWEHFGMMDDKDYVNANISKINEYARAGIIPGKNLIMTFETKDQVLDINTVNQLIKAYLL